MFKWLNKQGVESNKGFIVQTVSRFVIEYRQNSKKISLQVEVDYESSVDKVTVIVNKSSFIKWDDGETISQGKQAEIIQNFKDALEFQGIELIIED